jgi:hypothetical protein
LPDIFDEVEDDLRADRLRRTLLRYGGLLAGLAVAVIVGLAGYQGWKYYEGKQAVKLAESYLAASKLADGPAGPGHAEAAKRFADLAARSGPGYRTLARLREAALLATDGNAAGANAAWDAVANDSAADPLLRDVANLLWAQHNIDAGDPTAVAERLKKIAAPNDPLHGLAQEAQALLDLRQGQTDQARDMLHLLVQDTSAPQGVRQRAAGLLELIGDKKAGSS